MTIRRRRLWFVLIAGVVVAAIALGLCVAFGKSPYVTQTQIDQIKVGMAQAQTDLTKLGMTQAEVETILQEKFQGPVGGDFPTWRLETWTGEFRVTFHFGFVLWANHYPARSQMDMWTDRIRRKLGW